MHVLQTIEYKAKFLGEMWTYGLRISYLLSSFSFTPSPPSFPLPLNVFFLIFLPFLLSNSISIHNYSLKNAAAEPLWSETSLITSPKHNTHAKPKRVSDSRVTVGCQHQLPPFWWTLIPLEDSLSPLLSGMSSSDNTGLGPAAKPTHFDPVHGQSEWHFLSLLTNELGAPAELAFQILPPLSLKVAGRGAEPGGCSAHISRLVQIGIPWGIQVTKPTLHLPLSWAICSVSVAHSSKKPSLLQPGSPISVVHLCFFLAVIPSLLTFSVNWAQSQPSSFVWDIFFNQEKYEEIRF